VERLKLTVEELETVYKTTVRKHEMFEPKMKEMHESVTRMWLRLEREDKEVERVEKESTQARIKIQNDPEKEA
jgi:hypothetical protein